MVSLSPSLVPASDHLTNPECKLERLVPVHGGVELGAGAELAGVVHGQLVALPGHAAAAGRNVLNLGLELPLLAGGGVVLVVVVVLLVIHRLLHLDPPVAAPAELLLSQPLLLSPDLCFSYPDLLLNLSSLFLLLPSSQLL